MSPLTAPPARGYADWQRVNNYDTPVLFTRNVTGVVTDLTTDIIDVSRFAYLCLDDQVHNTAHVELIVHWFGDAGGQNPVGTVVVMEDGAWSNTYQMRLINAGPFVTLQWHLVSGTLDQYVYVFASNRIFPLSIIPDTPYLVDAQNVAVGAGASVVVPVNTWHAGPARLNANGTQPFTIVPRMLSLLNSYDQFDRIDSATGANVTANLVLPLGTWRLDLSNNGGAAGTFNVAMVPSTTGST